ncbi:tRNA (adenosine(37)-N6)-dimethylallyltransferase MiaA [soil metagenome]
MKTRDSDLPPVALIAGPTASGKSAIALALAEAMAKAGGGTVINADASQVYADLSIISARPSPEEMARAPHRLFGHVDGALACSAAQWAEEAKAEIARAHDAGRLPILVGGTGLYIRTLLDGIAPVPEIDPNIRSSVRLMTSEQVNIQLVDLSGQNEKLPHPADGARTARALEVLLSTGKPLSHWQRQTVGGIGKRIQLRPVILLPPRDWLIARCDARFATMVAGGAVEEVRALMQRDLSPQLPVMRAIGVREIAAWDAGAIDRDTMLERGRIATRQYAKRQYTWFSRQPPANWSRAYDIIDNNISAKIVLKLQN